jgi:putative cell wall-binding protein
MLHRVRVLGSRARWTVALGVGLALLLAIAAVSLPAIATAFPPAPEQDAQRLTIPFPRLSMWWPDSDNPSQTAVARARYDYMGLQNRDAHHVNELRFLNRDMILLGTNNARELNVRFDAGYDNSFNKEVQSASTDWIITQVGSTITSDIDDVTTTIPVADGAKFETSETALIDHELVSIVATSPTSLTVKPRGTVTPAAAHASGTRIASVASLWTGAIEFDVTASCPTADVGYGPETWSQWNVRRAHSVADSVGPEAAYYWDGVIVDCYDSHVHWWGGTGSDRVRNLDFNRDNSADNTAALDVAWNSGMTTLGAMYRAAMPDKVLLFNGNMRNFSSNGNIFEAFPQIDWDVATWNDVMFDWQYPRASYTEFLANAQSPNLTTFETYEYPDGPAPVGWTIDDYVPDYRKMRFGLCTALMGDGFFSFELSSSGHGTKGLFWFDEYDNAGVRPGYLGQPKGPAVEVVIDAEHTNVYRREYEHGIALVNPGDLARTVDLGRSFRKIKGTQAPSVNDGSDVTAVTLPPKDGIVLVKPFVLNGDDAYTTTTVVTAESAVASASEMCFDTGSGFGPSVPCTWSYSITLPEGDGPKTVTARYVGDSGTWEFSDAIVLDSTPPSTEATTYGVYGAFPRFLATDELSGVARTVWGAPEGVLITTLPGWWPIQYYSVDNAGNVEPRHFTAYKRVGLMFKPVYVRRAAIDLAAIDGSDTAEIYWALDSVDGTGSMVTTDTLGEHTLEYRPVDSQGNIAAAQTITFTIDPVTAERISGDDRYKNAAAVSAAHFSSATTVVVASGADAAFCDALSSAGLAGAVGGPMLLTKVDSLPASTTAEIQRLGASDVIIVGGTPSVSNSVKTALQNLGLTATRIDGDNRYEVAAAVGAKIKAIKGAAFEPTAFVAKGTDFPDALSCSAYAAGRCLPVLLTNPGSTSLPGATSAALTSLGIREAVIAGSTTSVSTTLENAIKNKLGTGGVVKRVSGTDRYAVAASMAETATAHGWATPSHTAVASGEVFADGMVGGAAVGSSGGLMLLTRGDALPTASKGFLEVHAREIDRCQVFGGTPTVSSGVLTAIDTALNR